MNNAMHLVTGSAGYVGGLISDKLLEEKIKVIGVDLHNTYSNINSKNLKSIQGDITDTEFLRSVFENNKNISCIYHCAAKLLYKNREKDLFFKTNIDSTKNLIDLAIKNKVKNFIYISSNCVYGKVNALNLPENTKLQPFEKYGESKLQSEKILMSYKDKINIVIIRPPTIIGEGRLGILSVVFDFIKENKKLCLVGSGNNKYQFVYGKDLAQACLLSSKYKKSNIFNIGTYDPHSLNQMFRNIIKTTNSKTKLYYLPSSIMLPIMKICYKIGISPLGPYQYNMMTNTYSGDITLIKNELNWEPTKNNLEILLDSYNYYIDNYDIIHNNSRLSGHKKVGKAGIIKLLKWLS